MRGVCVWTQNELVWGTECGYDITDFQDGMKFCPFCGRHIKIKEM